MDPELRLRSDDGRRSHYTRWWNDRSGCNDRGPVDPGHCDTAVRREEIGENDKGSTKVRGTMCGERGRDDGVDVRKKDRWRMMWMSPREGEGDDGFRATKERE